jgi:hypothetical protein
VKKTLLFWLLLLPAGAESQTLLAGKQYYKDFRTLAQVVIMNDANDEGGIKYLTKRGLIKENPENRAIVIVSIGQENDSGCEFSFPESPVLYWTFTQNVSIQNSPALTPVPVLIPVPISVPSVISVPDPPRPTPTPKVVTQEPAKQPTQRVAHKHREEPSRREQDDTPEKDKVWHQVNGKWKWYDKRNYAPRAQPVNSPAPQ